jgi:flagellin-like protein
MASMHRWRRAPQRRAVTPIIASCLLTAITVAAGVVLWTFHIQTPSSGVQVEYVAEGGQTEPAWGDPTDCSNQTIYASCDGLPAFFIVFTAHAPDDLLLTDLDFSLLCNKTSLVNGTFQEMEVIPGSGSNPGSGSPALGSCGSWKPSTNGNQATYFNRLTYFQQIKPQAKVLQDGDIFVVYQHPLATFCDRSGNCPDDDYHGAPPWCFTVPGACTIVLSYTGTPSSVLADIPMLEIGKNAYAQGTSPVLPTPVG